jgi:hypothetical protein
VFNTSNQAASQG